MRRSTRLTNGLSKKLKNLKAALALHFAWYNFVRIHRALGMTPAMAHGLVSELWKIDRLLPERPNLTHCPLGASKGIAAMGMNVVIEVLIANLDRHRKHLDDATITLIDQLVETGEQPDESQKVVLYLAERRLRHDLGDDEYFGRT